MHCSFIRWAFRIYVNIFCLWTEADGTPYEGGVFRMKLILSHDFPQTPPKGNRVRNLDWFLVASLLSYSLLGLPWFVGLIACFV